jgi:hypothetical protein
MTAGSVGHASYAPHQDRAIADVFSGNAFVQVLAEGVLAENANHGGTVGRGEGVLWPIDEIAELEQISRFHLIFGHRLWGGERRCGQCEQCGHNRTARVHSDQDLQRDSATRCASVCHLPRL